MSIISENSTCASFCFQNSSLNNTNDRGIYEFSLQTVDLQLVGIIVASIDLCLALLIIVGNTFVLVAVCCEHKLRTIPNAFIASLAVADLLVGLITIPIYSLFYLGVLDVVVNKSFCLLRCCMGVYSSGSSLLNLLLLSFDRYLAVIYPLRYNALMTPWRAKLVLIVLWIFSSITAFLPFLGFHRWSADAPCDVYIVLPRIYIYISIYSEGLLCLSLTTFIYIRIFCVAERHRKNLHASCMGVRRETKIRWEKELRSAKVMSFVLLIFVVCWLPYSVCGALKYIKTIPWDLLEAVKNFATSLTFSNSMVNPIIYAFLKKDFKEVFKKYLDQDARC